MAADGVERLISVPQESFWQIDLFICRVGRRQLNKLNQINCPDKSDKFIGLNLGLPCKSGGEQKLRIVCVAKETELVHRPKNVFSFLTFAQVQKF